MIALLSSFCPAVDDILLSPSRSLPYRLSFLLLLSLFFSLVARGGVGNGLVMSCFC